MEFRITSINFAVEQQWHRQQAIAAPMVHGVLFIAGLSTAMGEASSVATQQRYRPLYG